MIGSGNKPSPETMFCSQRCVFFQCVIVGSDCISKSLFSVVFSSRPWRSGSDGDVVQWWWQCPRWNSLQHRQQLPTIPWCLRYPVRIWSPLISITTPCNLINIFLWTIISTTFVTGISSKRHFRLSQVTYLVLPHYTHDRLVLLTHCDLAKPYGSIEMGQHWFR